MAFHKPSTQGEISVNPDKNTYTSPHMMKTCVSYYDILNVRDWDKII
jgi:hypothetical protein